MAGVKCSNGKIWSEEHKRCIEYIDPKTMREYWGHERPIEYKGKRYDVHKMSYGDYFFEPAGWRGGEKQGFHPDVIWFERIVITNENKWKQTIYVEQE
jgi:hypothetical protein